MGAHACMHVCVSKFVCVCACVRACACVCVCVRVHVCVYLKVHVMQHAGYYPIHSILHDDYDGGGKYTKTKEKDLRLMK